MTWYFAYLLVHRTKSNVTGTGPDLLFELVWPGPVWYAGPKCRRTVLAIEPGKLGKTSQYSTGLIRLSCRYTRCWGQ